MALLEGLDKANSYRCDVEEHKTYLQNLSDEALVDMLCNKRHSTYALEFANGKHYDKIKCALAINMVLTERGWSKDDINFIIKYGR